MGHRKQAAIAFVLTIIVTVSTLAAGESLDAITRERSVMADTVFGNASGNSLFLPGMVANMEASPYTSPAFAGYVHRLGAQLETAIYADMYAKLCMWDADNGNTLIVESSQFTVPGSAGWANYEVEIPPTFLPASRHVLLGLRWLTNGSNYVEERILSGTGVLYYKAGGNGEPVPALSSPTLEPSGQMAAWAYEYPASSVRVRRGGAWVTPTVKVRRGSSWVTALAKVRRGGSWHDV
jgi:hypothetical protein